MTPQEFEDAAKMFLPSVWAKLSADDEYERYSNISTLQESHLVYRDSDILNSVYKAHQQAEKAKAELRTESTAFVAKLPESLQFGLKDLGKRLFIGSTGRGLSVFIVAKEKKPLKPEEQPEDAPKEYTYEIETVKGNGW